MNRRISHRPNDFLRYPPLDEFWSALCWYRLRRAASVRSPRGVPDDYRPVPPSAAQTPHHDLRSGRRSCCSAALPPRSGPPAGLDPDKQIAQYVRTVWEASAGLPQNTVQAVLQTRDGYIWLGTEEGLVRFDGEKFDVFNRANTPELPGKDVNSLFEAPDGSLWIGMDGGSPA